MMRLVTLLCGCFLATLSTAQGQDFREDELRYVAKGFLQVVWDLGKVSKSRSVNTEEIEKAIGAYLQGKPENADKQTREHYTARRVMTIEFAKWLLEVSARAEDYALKPFLSIRQATPKEAENHKRCVVWKISFPEAGETFAWIFVFEDYEKTKASETGQKAPKIVTIGRIPSTAPPSAGLCF